MGSADWRLKEQGVGSVVRYRPSPVWGELAVGQATLCSWGLSAGGQGGTACLLALRLGRWGHLGSPQMGLKDVPGQQDSSIWGPPFRPHCPHPRGSKAQPHVWGGGRPTPPTCRVSCEGEVRLYEAPVPGRRGQVGCHPPRLTALGPSLPLTPLLLCTCRCVVRDATGVRLCLGSGGGAAPAPGRAALHRRLARLLTPPQQQGPGWQGRGGAQQSGESGREGGRGGRRGSSLPEALVPDLGAWGGGAGVEGGRGVPGGRRADAGVPELCLGRQGARQVGSRPPPQHTSPPSCPRSC